jgi:hypothetical protein
MEVYFDNDDNDETINTKTDKNHEYTKAARSINLESPNLKVLPKYQVPKISNCFN